MRAFANLSATLHSPRHWTRRGEESPLEHDRTATYPTDCPSGCDQTYRSGPANALALAPLIGSFLPPPPPPERARILFAHLAGVEREFAQCRKMDTGREDVVAQAAGGHPSQTRALAHASAIMSDREDRAFITLGPPTWLILSGESYLINRIRLLAGA